MSMKRYGMQCKQHFVVCPNYAFLCYSCKGLGIVNVTVYDQFELYLTP